jgi:hypothetical protein
MKWIPQDVETFLKAKEYVDTAVIPLVPIDFGEEMKQSAQMSEFITLLTNHLERQFTGRIVLLPPFTYLNNESQETLLIRLLKWKENVEGCGFKNIFYLTSDSDWKLSEEKLGSTLIWIPTLPLENMDESQKISLIDSQVKQLLNLFTRKWRENE